jgi:C4-dicarboxylate-specific signal transduction histidine kinase
MLSAVFATSILKSLDAGMSKLSSLMSEISKFNTELAGSNDRYLKQENKYLLLFNNEGEAEDSEFSGTVKESLRLNTRLKEVEGNLTNKIEALNKEITNDLRPKLKVEKNEAIDFLKYKVPDHLQSGFEDLFDIQRIKSSDVSLYVLCEKILTDLNLFLDVARGESQISDVKREYLFKINNYRFEKIQKLKIRHYLKLKAGRLAKLFAKIQGDLKNLSMQQNYNLSLKKKVLEQFQTAKLEEQGKFAKTLKNAGLNFELRFVLVAQQIKNQLFFGISLFLPLVLFVLFLFFKMVVGPIQELLKGEFKTKLPFLSEIKDLLKRVMEQQDINLSLQGELIHKEKLAVMGGVTNMLAHEFKNPLSIIQLSLDDLRETINEGQKAEVDKIENMVDRMNDQIKNLNSFGNSSLEVDELDIHLVLENVLKMYQGILVRSNVQVLKEIDENLQKLKLPTSLVEIVFINIIGNAIRALEKIKSPVLKIDIEEEKNNVIVKIVDNGEGISSENINKVFQPYFSTKESENGSGLGLHIVKNIMTQLDGEISVTSNEEDGTKFQIELPRT